MIGEVLVAARAVTQAQLDLALERQRASGGSIGDALVATGAITEDALAEALARLGLPARLMPAVLAFATQDVLDSSRPAYLDDWAALAAAVRSLPESRIADHAAALTAGGALIPSDRDSSNDVRH